MYNLIYTATRAHPSPFRLQPLLRAMLPSRPAGRPLPLARGLLLLHASACLCAGAERSPQPLPLRTHGRYVADSGKGRGVCGPAPATSAGSGSQGAAQSPERRLSGVPPRTWRSGLGFGRGVAPRTSRSLPAVSHHSWGLSERLGARAVRSASPSNMWVVSFGPARDSESASPRNPGPVAPNRRRPGFGAPQAPPIRPLWVRLVTLRCSISVPERGPFEFPECRPLLPEFGPTVIGIAQNCTEFLGRTRGPKFDRARAELWPGFVRTCRFRPNWARLELRPSSTEL